MRELLNYPLPFYHLRYLRQRPGCWETSNYSTSYLSFYCPLRKIRGCPSAHVVVSYDTVLRHIDRLIEWRVKPSRETPLRHLRHWSQCRLNGFTSDRSRPSVPLPSVAVLLCCSERTADRGPAWAPVRLCWRAPPMTFLPRRIHAACARFRAITAAMLCAQVHAQISWKRSVNLGESCIATCGNFGLPCAETGFPVNICQGQYLQDSNPALADWPAFPAGCDHGQFRSPINVLCVGGEN